MEEENTSATRSSKISYAELKRHSTYSDAWISINGVVYNITCFIERHPFGDTFRGSLGTECGGLFSSSHSNTNVEGLIKNGSFLRKNNIEVIGALDVSEDQLGASSDAPLLDRIVYIKTHDDKFWLELKDKVAAYLKENRETTHYTFKEGISYIIYYLVIYLVLSYLAWVEGSVIASILLGIHMICALANISHMATHFGFTKSRFLDFVAVHLFDLSGLSGLEWQITHQTHHNQPHSSIDHQTNVYDYLGVRIHQYLTHKNFHKYQRIYFWFVISPYLLFKFFSTTIWLVQNKEFVRHKYEFIAHVTARGLLLAQIVVCIYLQGYAAGLLLVLLYSISYSQTAFILLFNDHEDTHKPLGRAEDISAFHHKKSWAELQVRTSNNWYPTNWILSFFEFHCGYFNYHIEHHLFPSYKPSLLKKISPIVRSVCAKYDIPYISTPFMSVQKSLQQHITKMGVAKVVAESSSSQCERS